MQAYGLKSLIEQLGYDVNFIDIESGTHFEGLRRSRRMYLTKLIERFFVPTGLTALKLHLKLRARFKNEFYGDLGLDSESVANECVVIGSDEVFNFAQPTPWGFSTQLYGKVAGARRVISYAGSFGHTTFEDIQKFGVQEKIRSAMDTMYATSVRDYNSAEIARKLLPGKDVSIHLDPALIYDFSDKIVEPNRKNKYVLVYTYPGRIKSTEEINAIKEIARRKDLQIISVGFYFPWCDEVIVPHPFEVLGYFKNAEFIITDTFHGTIFSIINQSRFCTLIRKTNRQKLSALLDMMGLSSQIATNGKDIIDLSDSNPSFTEAFEKISIEREKSLTYVRSNLA